MGTLSPGRAAQLVAMLFRTPKGCGVDPWSGHIQEATNHVSLSHRRLSLTVSLSHYVCVLMKIKDWQEIHWKDHFENLTF